MFGFGENYSCRITLDGLFEEGSIIPTSYNIVKDENYIGEVRIGLNFFPRVSIGYNAIFSTTCCPHSTFTG